MLNEMNAATAKHKAGNLTPVKAIKKNCLECSGVSKKEVRVCVIIECPLYPYRMGKNPNRKGVGKGGSRLAAGGGKIKIERI